MHALITLLLMSEQAYVFTVCPLNCSYHEGKAQFKTCSNKERVAVQRTGALDQSM